MDYLNFAALRLCKISEALHGGAVTVVCLFVFWELQVKNLLLCPLKSRHHKFRSSMCSVVKYFYNSLHVFYCKVQSDNSR